MKQTFMELPARPGQCAEWYANAKFGIFIHWGPPSVPAYASGDMSSQQMIKQEGFTYYFKNNPYAEWYRNTMHIAGSPAQKHHKKHWGDQPYEYFGQLFNEHSARDNHEYFKQWAHLFKRAGARYVVPVAKHHDGFTLWPSKVPAPLKNWSARVDLVGKIREQVLAHGMRFGVYYSGMYDWTWNPTGIRNFLTSALNGAQSPEIVAYMDGHVKELIENYQPAVLWNDIGYVTHGTLPGEPEGPFKSLQELWNYYYMVVNDGNVDDRWFQLLGDNPDLYPLLVSVSKFFMTDDGLKASEFLDGVFKLLYPGYDKPATGLSFLPSPHDYNTYEYEVPDDMKPDNQKWELVMGIGLSFCYNEYEDHKNWMSYPDLVQMFVDVVSKNGNLLLNVGPKSNGELQTHEVKLLEDFGGWMDIYGDAIYDTKPWQVIGATAYMNFPFSGESGELAGPAKPRIRFTVKGDALNVFFNITAGEENLFIPSVQLQAGTVVELWTSKDERQKLKWIKEKSGISVSVPRNTYLAPFRCFTISPVPVWTPALI